MSVRDLINVYARRSVVPPPRNLIGSRQWRLAALGGFNYAGVIIKPKMGILGFDTILTTGSRSGGSSDIRTERRKWLCPSP